MVTQIPTQQRENCCTGLAIASVPMQVWRQPLAPEAAFTNGTIFAELVLPYTPPGSNASADMQRRLMR